MTDTTQKVEKQMEGTEDKIQGVTTDSQENVEETSQVQAEGSDTEEALRQQATELENARKAAMAFLEDDKGEEKSSATDEKAVEATPVQTEANTSTEAQEETAKVEEATNENNEEENEDFSHLSKTEVVQMSTELLSEKDLVKADRVIRKLKTVLDPIFRGEKEEARKKFLADGGEVDAFTYNDTEVEKFFANFKAIKENKKKHFDGIKQEREKNFKEKSKILDEIKKLIEEADQKGSLDKIKELQQKWKSIGSVPQTEAENLYRSYGALLDMFYDNKSIEYDLKELDRKKNLTAKLELCDKAETLLGHDNINEAVSQLSALHEDFKSIGPVPKEEQENIWQRFKTASDKLYEKKRAFAEEFKQQLKENMEAKQALCLQVEPFITFDSDRIKEWNDKTKELLDIQEQWEKIGPLPREVAKDINKQFWGNFKGFFANKNKFFEKLEKMRAENLEKKEALCVKAEEIKDNTDWNETADALKELQKQWKGVGPVPEAHRDSIYERFKTACDYFFERKRNRKSIQEEEFKNNLQKKLELCEELTALAKGEEVKYDAGVIEEYKEKYNAIGFVPRKDMNTVLDSFMKAIEDYVDASDLSQADKEKTRIELQADLMKNIPNASRKLQRQEQGIRNKINNIENDISLWQNNLEFFAKSKTADKLRDEFQEKVDVARAEIKRLKEQLTIIRNIGKEAKENAKAKEAEASSEENNEAQED